MLSPSMTRREGDQPRSEGLARTELGSRWQLVGPRGIEVEPHIVQAYAMRGQSVERRLGAQGLLDAYLEPTSEVVAMRTSRTFC